MDQRIQRELREQVDRLDVDELLKLMEYDAKAMGRKGATGAAGAAPRRVEGAMTRWLPALSSSFRAALDWPRAAERSRRRRPARERSRSAIRIRM